MRRKVRRYSFDLDDLALCTAFGGRVPAGEGHLLKKVACYPLGGAEMQPTTTPMFEVDDVDDDDDHGGLQGYLTTTIAWLADCLAGYLWVPAVRLRCSCEHFTSKELWRHNNITIASTRRWNRSNIVENSKWYNTSNF